MSNKEKAELEFYRRLKVKRTNLGGEYEISAQQLWNQLQNQLTQPRTR